LKIAGNLAALRVDATVQVPIVAREAIIAQGLSSFKDFVGLTDQYMKDICTNAKRPGGAIQNPKWVAGDNMPQMIPNPGALVGFIHELRL
jgi:hypothetical protein